MRAIRLRCEYLVDPIGIDIQEPRLMWNCGAWNELENAAGAKQTAYQIVTDKWDSGKVESSAMQAVYPLPLESRERVTWKIRLWDGNGEAGEWSESFFEMGLLQASDWKAEWITGDYTPKKNMRYPVDCFRKEISFAKPVASARLYATACGLYEAKLNGRKAGTFCFAPGYTDYRKRVQYQSYDVTELLRPGKNELTVQLADGWYRGSLGAWGLTYQYGTETKILLQLEITYEDSTTETVVTDRSWQWSDDGPIRFADQKDGEIVEAFREPSYAGHSKETTHNVLPTASDNVPVTEHEHFHPVVTTAPNGRKLLDFGARRSAHGLAFGGNAGSGRQSHAEEHPALEQEEDDTTPADRL